MHVLANNSFFHTIVELNNIMEKYESFISPQIIKLLKKKNEKNLL